MLHPHVQSQSHTAPATQLTVHGTLPTWLNGTLVRNCPSIFETGNTTLRHWFDGYGALHSFVIEQGVIEYRSEIIASQEYTSAKKTGKNKWITWGSSVDPCEKIFQKFSAIFTPADNTSIAIAKLGEQYYSTSDIGIMNEFDSTTLALRSRHELIRNGVMAAHPAFAHDGKMWNMKTAFGFTGKHTVISMNTVSDEQKHATFSTPKFYYYHSFAGTENYFVSIEQPLYLNFWRLLTAPFTGRSYYESFTWHKSATNIVHVYNKQTATMEHIVTPFTFFFFHTVHSFEQDNKLYIDFCGYADDAIIRDFYLQNLHTAGVQENNKARLMRLRIDVTTHEVTLEDYAINLELPNCNHSQIYNTVQWYYGIHSFPNSPNIADALIKYNVQHRTPLLWHVEGVLPSEPIFVANPEGSSEDDGVVLSVCYEVATNQSFLLVLDAHTFTEVARTYTPEWIPASLHGMFYR